LKYKRFNSHTIFASAIVEINGTDNFVKWS
jgi:hypothetical protein